MIICILFFEMNLGTGEGSPHFTPSLLVPESVWFMFLSRRHQSKESCTVHLAPRAGPVRHSSTPSTCIGTSAARALAWICFGPLDPLKGPLCRCAALWTGLVVGVAYTLFARAMYRQQLAALQRELAAEHGAHLQAHRQPPPQPPLPPAADTPRRAVPSLAAPCAPAPPYHTPGDGMRFQEDGIICCHWSYAHRQLASLGMEAGVVVRPYVVTWRRLVGSQELP